MLLAKLSFFIFVKIIVNVLNKQNKEETIFPFSILSDIQ